MINQGGIRVVQLKTSELANLCDINQKFKLDFDDAYQYAVAEKHNLTIVSFDHDFDKTKLGRKTPAQLTKKNPRKLVLTPRIIQLSQPQRFERGQGNCE